MAPRVNRRRRDDRVEQILRDPKAYFDKARQRAEAEVRREMEAESKRPRHGVATA